MVRELIILFAFLVVVSYIINVFSQKIKVPAVIFLLAIGTFLRFLAIRFKIPLPDLTSYLMFMGGISLILVVLEGSMELRWAPEKNKLILRMFLLCILPMLFFSFAGAWLITLFQKVSYQQALYNLIPFSIISSAVAIPATHILAARPREQIIYESSFSDIMGILFFDFVIQDRGKLLEETGIFLLQLGGTFVLTVLATIFIAWLLGFLPKGVRFIPIIANLVLIFEVSEFFNLPGLIFIFVFGLFLGNLSRFTRMKPMRRIHPDRIKANFEEFHNIVSEANFLVRSFFFLLLGFFINPLHLLSLKTIFWAIGILVFIYAVRALFLKLLGVSLLPNLFFAPRGLVSILLFLYIPLHQLLPEVTLNLVIQVVILSTVVMAIGGFVRTKKQEEESLPEVDPGT
ncbi:MAG: hypothetical protein RR303_08395 [Bacteroidales bacterium]